MPEGLADRRRRRPEGPARSRSTRAPTSTTCWCGRWRRPALGYGDIEPVYLPPADARAAFERGAVDAWVIWDPFLAAAQAATGARTLADGTGLVKQPPVLPRRAGLRRRPARPIVQAILADIGDDRPLGVGQHGRGRGPARAAASASRRRCSRWRSTGMGYGVQPLDDDVVAEQQKIADTFHALGLLPKPITVQGCRLEGHAHDAAPADHRRPLVPADPRRRPLSRHQPGRARGRPRATCARSPRRPTISAISACCCRPGARCEDSLGGRLGAGAADRAAALPGRRPARPADARGGGPHGGDARPDLRRPAADQRRHRRRPGRAQGRRPVPRPRRPLRRHRRVPARLARGCWPARRSTIEGEHLRIEGGQLFFPPVQQPYPPLYFGGSSDAGIEIAAEQVDIYLTWGEPPADVAQKIEQANARPRPRAAASCASASACTSSCARPRPRPGPRPTG